MWETGTPSNYCIYRKQKNKQKILTAVTFGIINNCWHGLRANTRNKLRNVMGFKYIMGSEGLEMKKR